LLKVNGKEFSSLKGLTSPSSWGRLEGGKVVVLVLLLYRVLKGPGMKGEASKKASECLFHSFQRKGREWGD